MKDDERPAVVDLKRYRRERAEAARRQAAPPSQPILGGRRNAGVILVLVALVLLALWLGPRFF